jgi:hypothetical protein
MKRPIESDYTSLVAYTRALEEYCDDLAQPAQKPVVWTGVDFDIKTAPPKRPWVGLTDEQIETIWKRVQANDFHDCVQPFARAIEAAHRIKENT